jgi:hypothetical protein
MNLTPAERLERIRMGRAVDSVHASSTIADLAKLEHSNQLLSDIQVCLSGSSQHEILTAFYVLKGLLIDTAERNLPEAFRQFLVSRTRELLSHASDAVAFEATDLIARMRYEIADYRELMLRQLKSDRPARRQMALKHFATYASPGEVEPLMPFREDPYAGETRPLGNWEYELRNGAFDAAERQLGIKLPRQIRSEPYEGRRVTWIDWGPLLEIWMKTR